MARLPDVPGDINRYYYYQCPDCNHTVGLTEVVGLAQWDQAETVPPSTVPCRWKACTGTAEPRATLALALGIYYRHQVTTEQAEQAVKQIR